MNIVNLRDRARSLVRDINGGYFTDNDLRNYTNEAIDRMKQVVPELRGMTYLYNASDRIIILPEEWHHLLAIYCASRLCTQDERAYQAGTFMNEFETKLLEFKSMYEAGEIDLFNEDGTPVVGVQKAEYVKNAYYFDHYGRMPREDDY